MWKSVRWGGFAGCALLLAGCGGGGDDPAPAPAPPPPAPPPATQYTIGGTISGLAPGGILVLQNNGGSNLTANANGTFTFAGGVASGGAYSVTVLTHPTVPPPGQECLVTGGSGTVASANVTGISVSCSNLDVTPPTILSRTPLPTAIGAAVTGPVVTVTFSEAMDPSSLTTSSLKVTGAGGPVAGTVSLAADNTQAVFTPASRLAFDADYTVTVTTAATDASGNALEAETNWKFNTGRSVVVGLRYACARLDDGRVKCWGTNTYGQLGYDDNISRGDGAGPSTSTLPTVNLGAGRKAVALAAADFHTCAILDDGSARCWGRNDYGQLGQGAVTPALGDEAGEMAALQPIDLGAGRKVLDIAVGQFSTCARLDDATVKCWGDNTRGQLGRGNLLPLGVAPGDIAAAAPVALGAGGVPVQISMGHYHACVVLEDEAAARSVKCWGENNWSQIGNGGTPAFLVGDAPDEMGDNLPAVALAPGRSPLYLMATGAHTCVQLDDLSAQCWGLNTWGQVGSPGGNNRAPTDLDPVRQSCAGGPLDCWGDEPGEMGAALPVAIPAGVTARLSIGFRHNCIVRADTGDVQCWGANQQAQLGLGVPATDATAMIGDEPGEMASLTSVALKPGRTVEEIAAGGFQTCVRYTDGSINCWGENSGGALGRNDAEPLVGDGPGEMGNALVDVSLGS